jgi:ribosomal protein S16
MDDLILPGGPRILKDADGAYRLVGRQVDLRQPGSPSGSYRITAEDLLLAAARMRRDGASFEAIRRHLDPMPHVTDAQVEHFLKLGMELLERRIAEGKEPEESVHTIAVAVDLPDDEP